MNSDIPFFIQNFKKDGKLANLDSSLKRIIKNKFPYQFFIFYCSASINHHVFAYKNLVKINPVEQEYFYGLLLKKKFNFTDKVLENFLKDNFSSQEKYFSIYPIAFKKKNVFSLVASKSLNQEEQNFLANLTEEVLFSYDYFKTQNQKIIHENILEIHTLPQFLKCIKKEMVKNISLNKLLVFLQQDKKLFPLTSKKIPAEISQKIDLEKLKRSKENCYLEELSILPTKNYKIPSSLVIAFPLNEKDDVVFYLEKKVNDYFDDWEIDYVINWREIFQKHLVKKFIALETSSEYFFSSKTKKLEMLISNDLDKDLLQSSVTLPEKNFKLNRLGHFTFSIEDDSLLYQKKNLEYCLGSYFPLEDLINQLLVLQNNALFSKDFFDHFFLLDIKSDKDKLQIISSKNIHVYSFSFKTGELVTNKTPCNIPTSSNSKIEFVNYSWDNLDEQNLFLFFDRLLKKEMVKVIKEKLILLGDLTPAILIKELKQDKKLTSNCLGVIKIT